MVSLSTPLLAKPVRPVRGWAPGREAQHPPAVHGAAAGRRSASGGASTSERACGPARPAAAAAAAAASCPAAAALKSRPPPPPKPFMRYVGLVPVRPLRRGTRVAAAADGVTPAILSGGAELSPPSSPPASPPPLTRSDAAFAADGLEFVWGSDGLDLADLNDLFEKVGFPRREPARLGAALAHSHRVLWVRCTKGTRWARAGQLLGFARTTSDGALAATVWDVAVSPAWQRGGLGRALVERLTAGVVHGDGIPTVTLYAEPGVVGWYERCGYAPDPGGAKGMAFQRTSEAGKALVGRALARKGLAGAPPAAAA